jgi:hypothetical protein
MEYFISVKNKKKVSQNKLVNTDLEPFQEFIKKPPKTGGR